MRRQASLPGSPINQPPSRIISFHAAFSFPLRAAGIEATAGATYRWVASSTRTLTVRFPSSMAMNLFLGGA